MKTLFCNDNPNNVSATDGEKLLVSLDVWHGDMDFES